MTKAPDKIEKIVDFLCGAAPNDQGEWFSDVAERERGNFWWRKWVRHIEREAESNALALVAAERDDAASQINQLSHTATATGNFTQAATLANMAEDIRARTDDDAHAALERLLEKARNEALREAFNTLRAYAPHQVDGPEHDVGYASRYATAQNCLLALITEDQSDEG